MIEVILEKGDARRRLAADSKEFTWANAKVKFSQSTGKPHKVRYIKSTSTPVADLDISTHLLLKAYKEAIVEGFIVISEDGIELHAYELFLTDMAAIPAIPQEMVTLALENNATRDQAETDIEELAKALGVTFRQHTKQVTDSKDPESIYTLGTMHSGCAKPGSRMEGFLAALAWRFKRPLVCGVITIEPRPLLEHLEGDTRERLAELGFGPTMLRLRTSTNLSSLVW